MGFWDLALGALTGGGSALLGGGKPALTPEQQAAQQKAQLRNNPLYRRTASQAQAFQDFLPQYLKTIGDQTMPSELANLAAQQATAPGYQAIQDAQRKQSAATSVDIAGGAGRDLANTVSATDQSINPQYYALRDKTAQGLLSLLQPGLTGGETEAINRSQAQQGASRGTGFAPSATETVSNASQFGNAARSRLSGAISQATSAIPTMKSGIDVQGLSGGAATPSGTSFMNTAAGQAGGLQGQIGSTANNLVQQQMGQKDTLDKIGQIAGIAGSVTSSL